MTDQSDMFGDADPRDFSRTKAFPKFEAPRENSTLRALTRSGERSEILIQPELFEEAVISDSIEYQGYKAYYHQDGRWSVVAPDSTQKYIDLGIFRFAAAGQLARWVDDKNLEPFPSSPRNQVLRDAGETCLRVAPGAR